MSAEVRVNLVTVPATSIFPNVWNPNEQTDFIYEKERVSIRTHGFIDPILVREISEGYEIIDGEHRWRAAQAEGIESIPCNNLGSVSDSVAKQLTIIMNETRGQARRDKLTDLLKDLSGEIGMDALYEALPYQQIEIDSMVQQTEINWDDLNNKSGDADSQSKDEDGDDWRSVTFRLPEGVADQLEEQISRVKKLLHPDEEASKCSPVMAIEAICQHLSQTDDENLI